MNMTCVCAQLFTFSSRNPLKGSTICYDRCISLVKILQKFFLLPHEHHKMHKTNIKNFFALVYLKNNERGSYVAVAIRAEQKTQEEIFEMYTIVERVLHYQCWFFYYFREMKLTHCGIVFFRTESSVKKNCINLEVQSEEKKM